MNSDKFEARMRALESYHSIKVPADTWLVVRVDGRSFSRVTEDLKFEKPFDPTFAGFMVNTTKELVNEFKAVYAFTESDEISLLLPPSWDLFDRELEKIVSVSAAAAASKFTSLIAARTEDPKSASYMFDSRVCVCPNESVVTDYFRWRQSDANRCAINGYCYWTLRKEGLSASKASSLLKGKTQEDKMALLAEKGVKWDEIPGWQKNGTGLYWVKFPKMGVNPKTGQTTEVTRRGIRTEHDLPTRDEYTTFLQSVMAETSGVAV